MLSTAKSLDPFRVEEFVKTFPFFSTLIPSFLIIILCDFSPYLLVDALLTGISAKAISTGCHSYLDGLERRDEVGIWLGSASIPHNVRCVFAVPSVTIALKLYMLMYRV
ncbi:hypothetical protein Tco_1332310 [Tanacetum coccineum]